VIEGRLLEELIGRFFANDAVTYLHLHFARPGCYAARVDRVYYANTRIDAAAIGFDDDHIYRELDKPIDGRAVPFIHLQSDEARQIFKEWLEKADKIPY
jgi:hypothetical protein